jgi:hypothetical protein
MIVLIRVVTAKLSFAVVQESLAISVAKYVVLIANFRNTDQHVRKMPSGKQWTPLMQMMNVVVIQCIVTNVPSVPRCEFRVNLCVDEKTAKTAHEE